MSERTRIRDVDSEMGRDIQDVLDGIPLISLQTFNYTATGSTATTIDLSWGVKSDKLARNSTAPPVAALVVRVIDLADASGNPGNFRVGLNFEFASSSTGDHTVRLYEPEGLTADQEYRITVMWVG